MPQLGLGLGLQRANRALFRGLLDQYGGAAAAYSLRALSSGWLAGDVVEVRRSEDSVQVKVGLVGGIVTLDSKVTNVTETPDQGETLASNLGEFVAASGYANPDSLAGANDGFVSTWYDQSGNANNATQPTTTEQPKVVDAGALVTGGLDFDGVDDEMMVVGDPIITADYTGTFSTFGVHTVATAEVGYLYGNASSGAGASQYSRNTLDEYTTTGGTDTTLDKIAGSSSELILSSVYNNGDAGLLINGAGSMTDQGTYSFTAGTVDFTIGNRSGGGSASTILAGQIQEIIIYNSDQSANRAAIEENINEHYSIY